MPSTVDATTPCIEITTTLYEYLYTHRLPLAMCGRGVKDGIYFIPTRHRIVYVHEIYTGVKECVYTCRLSAVAVVVQHKFSLVSDEHRNRNRGSWQTCSLGHKF
ncbi:hypothetical protein PoB_006997000 [Plakobranchus ocellatus]|uniref:Uncharacterized protein n=1 Tax=Plakobranchus ocellatus TaxID=259542 RepID=A0AAV4DH62_9GAST|nr:hypothetical protein PoB_006997000 [Plakobranchus ocellatus]